MRRPEMPAVYRAFAILLPALLGQGLIYLCITEQIGIAAAMAFLIAIGAIALTAATLARMHEERRLVGHNLPPAYLRVRRQHFPGR